MSPSDRHQFRVGVRGDSREILVQAGGPGEAAMRAFAHFSEGQPETIEILTGGAAADATVVISGLRERIEFLVTRIRNP